MFGHEEESIIPFVEGKYVCIGEHDGKRVFGKILHEATHLDAGHEQTLLVERPDGSHETTSLTHLIGLNPGGALDSKPEN